MNTSFYNGISGIKTQQFGLDVWANNIANIGTNGFLGKTPEFSTVFATTLTDSYFDSTSNDIGTGSTASAASLNTYTQGVLQPTDRVFDLALDGKGWFGVQSSTGETLYTRNGAFNIDANGDLVDDSGNFLLGTLGGNITPTTLSQKTLEDFGTYYKKTANELGNPYQIESINNITLSTVENQSKINLPDILYFPPEATTNVSYSANLDPKIIVSSTQINLNDLDVTTTFNSLNQTININGTVSNTPELQNPKESDIVLVTITDINGDTVETRSTLDSNLNWAINNEDLSSLDTTNPLITTAKLQTTQEIPNVEHFSSTIISPSGEKDILDMTYTKRVPQPTEGSTWDGVIKILSFYEKYDPSQTYDPTLFEIDEPAGKVYQIIDQQQALVEFQGSGALLNSTIPTMSNSGSSLTIDVGEPNSFAGFVSNINLDKSRSETHDGYVSGILKDYGMDNIGNVIAEFDNGRSTPIAKVAVYHFRNPQGLSNVTSTLFSPTSNSGNALFYTDENGVPFLGAKIRPNNLEASNVSFNTALTELIITQKAFDASSKSITTSDQMIQNAINMKR